MKSKLFQHFFSFRLSGFLFIGIYCLLAVAQTGSYHESVPYTVDKRSIIKTFSRVTEIQCILRCRRDSACERSLYEKTADCHLLKDVRTTNGNYHEGISGILHSQIGIDLLCIT